jgi:hypothetical protein
MSPLIPLSTVPLTTVGTITTQAQSASEKKNLLATTDYELGEENLTCGYNETEHN